MKIDAGNGRGEFFVGETSADSTRSGDVGMFWFAEVPVRRRSLRSSATPIFAPESGPGGRRAVPVSESNAARELHPNERA